MICWPFFQCLSSGIWSFNAHIIQSKSLLKLRIVARKVFDLLLSWCGIASAGCEGARWGFTEQCLETAGPGVTVGGKGAWSKPQLVPRKGCKSGREWQDRQMKVAGGAWGGLGSVAKFLHSESWCTRYCCSRHSHYCQGLNTICIVRMGVPRGEGQRSLNENK